MREVVAQWLNHRISRRGFIRGLAAAGLTPTAIEAVLSNLETVEAAPPHPDNGYRILTGTGGELWVAQLKASGVEYVFCNPGSAEVGFYDALTDTPGLQVIMGLHEGVVISMADGYHKVTGRPAFVNVHAMPGTAQMGGQLYNANKSQSCLVITAGMSDNTVFSDDPGLGPAPGFNQADVTKPITKIAWDVRQPATVPVALRRAFKLATTPPGGPVYISVANYAQGGEPATAQIVDQSKFLVPMRPRPDVKEIEEVARRLIEATQPLMVVDSDLSRCSAVEEALRLVDLLGLAVVDPRGSRSTHSGFPNQHPLYWDGKIFGGRDRQGGSSYADYDVIVGVGSENIASVRARGHAPDRVTQAPESFKAVIGVDVGSMGRTAPFDLGVVADPKAALEDLLDAVNSLATKERLARLRKERFDRVAPQIAEARRRAEKGIHDTFGRQPMHPCELAMTLESVLDRDAVTVNENLSHDFSLRHGVIQHYGGQAKMRLASGGGSLGWGIGAAIGAKIGQPDRQVVLHIGDGSVMYSASGFWTMARYEVPLLVVVWNNHNYQTVRHGFARYKGKMAKTGHYTGMHLGNPDIDFPALAKSQGVEGEKAMDVADLKAALERGIAATRGGAPYVIDVEIAQVGGGAGSSWYQKFSVAEKRTRQA